MTEATPATELYQVRIFLRKEFAEAVSRGETPKEIQPLLDILAKHGARIDHNQQEEFENFLRDVDAGKKTQFKDHELPGMYAMTTNAVNDPVKSSYFKREFTLSVAGQVDAMFKDNEADALIADLQTLGDGGILTSGMAFRGKGFEVPPVRKSKKPKGDHPVPAAFKNPK